MWQHLRSDLQPIVHAHLGTILGHEALLRGEAGTEFESPDALIGEATQHGTRETLEAKARELAVARLPDLPADQWLFINIDTANPDLPILPAESPVAPERIVLEISEKWPILDNPRLLAQVDAWRAAGFRIAVDDYGNGYMGLGAVFALKPDVLKIDRVVTSGAVHDDVRQAAIEAVLHIAARAHMVVIAEGVETPQEYWLLRSLGVRYMQGFLLGRPQSEPQRDRVKLPSRVWRLPASLRARRD